MSIQKLIIPMRAIPKPRGQIGKYGNMTHSIGKYREWQEQFKKHIACTTFYVPKEFYSMVFKFNLAARSGGKPDLSNLQGGVEDALVKHKYIPDDNWKILQRFYTCGSPASISSIELFVCTSKKETLYVIDKFTD
jgi:Holliday junction resolvase RusA-like endonuclease